MYLLPRTTAVCMYVLFPFPIQTVRLVSIHNAPRSCRNHLFCRLQMHQTAANPRKNDESCMRCAMVVFITDTLLVPREKIFVLEVPNCTLFQSSFSTFAATTGPRIDGRCSNMGVSALSVKSNRVSVSVAYQEACAPCPARVSLMVRAIDTTRQGQCHYPYHRLFGLIRSLDYASS